MVLMGFRGGLDVTIGDGGAESAALGVEGREGSVDGAAGE